MDLVGSHQEAHTSEAVTTDKYFGGTLLITYWMDFLWCIQQLAN